MCGPGPGRGAGRAGSVREGVVFRFRGTDLRAVGGSGARGAGARPTRTSALPWIARPGRPRSLRSSRLAIAGTARGDLERAEAWLRDPAESAVARGGNPPSPPLAGRNPHDGDSGRAEAGVPERLAGAPGRCAGFRTVLLRPAMAEPARPGQGLRAAHGGPVQDAVAAGRRLGRARRDAAFFGKDIQGAKLSYDEALRLDETERTRYWLIVPRLCDVVCSILGYLATKRLLREQEPPAPWRRHDLERSPESRRALARGGRSAWPFRSLPQLARATTRRIPRTSHRLRGHSIPVP